MPSIRKATEADIAELVRLRTEFLIEDNGPDRLPGGFDAASTRYFTSAFIDGSFVCFLAEENGSIVATGGVCFYRVAPNFSNPSGNVAYILNMYTLPAFRHQGLATALLGRIIGEARERGIKKLALSASKAGRSVYAALGFTNEDDDMVLFLE